MQFQKMVDVLDAKDGRLLVKPKVLLSLVMAPRTLEIIIGALQVDKKTFNVNLLSNIEEILSHTKDNILKHLGKVVDESLIFSLREYLSTELLNKIEFEEYASNGILLDEVVELKTLK